MYRDAATTPFSASTHSRLEELAQIVAQVDRAGGPPSRALAAELFANWSRLVEAFDDPRGSAESVARVRAALIPLLERSELGRRILTKPRGYAGDYLTIAMMYEDVVRGDGAVGTLVDRALRNHPACRAVIHRRGILSEEIDRARTEAAGETARVTSLACGPAAELFDVFASLEDPSVLAATCVDIDREALDFVAHRAEADRVSDHFELHEANLVHLATGRRSIDVAPQDLVYSIGLIDYFDDKFVVRLLDYVHGILRPGGRAVFGNFHVDNPARAVMDHVLDWRLIHRSEADMHRLFRSSRFGRDCTRIHFESAGVNMFAECVRSRAGAESR